ncbi:Hypothetical protein CINCED_3A010242 [Cinara cedri]|nr:Hypothetical protein CINCED_3A010242 [Cinara cedri]
MRICILSVLKELIVNVLNCNLDEFKRKTRDNYISILQDHLLDINAFVRSKTLQLLASIINENCLPKDKYLILLRCAVEKLNDKSSYVIKSAIQLIKTLIKLNPYSCDFSEKQLNIQMEEQNCLLKNIKHVLEFKLHSDINENMWPTIEMDLTSFLDHFFENNSLENFSHLQVFNDIELSEVIVKIKNYIALHKYKEAVEFVLRGRVTFKNESLFKLQNEDNLSIQFVSLLKNIWFRKNANTSVVPNNLEEFKNTTLEELNLQIILTQSKIEYIQACFEYLNIIRKSLDIISKLFWNTTTESIEAIEFFTTAYLFGVPHSQYGINCMLKLIHSSDTNVKEAVINSYKTIYLDTIKAKEPKKRTIEITTKLLNLVKTLSITNREAFKILLAEWIKNKTLDDDCIMLLWSWITKSATKHIENKYFAAFFMSLIVGAKPGIVRGNMDLLIEYGLCDVYPLFNYTCQILDEGIQEDFTRFHAKHKIVHNIICVVKKSYNECNVQIFNDVATNAVHMIYKLTVKPDVTCLALIKTLFDMLMMKKIKCDSTEKNDKNFNINCNLLSKFIYIIGQIALEQYFYLENYVLNELTQRVRTKYQTIKLNMSKNQENESMYDSEAAEIEVLNNHIRNVYERRLVCGTGLLSYFSKYIIKSCESNYSDLKGSAILSLIKFMIVSSKFCQDHLQVFLNLMENTENSDQTIDLIIGFGWLVVRHPNLMEPFTDKIYARLTDKRYIVRYSAFKTIIDLINQEMFKIRGQVAGIARLIVDDNETIKRDARNFFGSIAEKKNSLYNVISDIISTLSNPETAVPENDFITIMNYLLPLINKERQIESLIDKLCMRLKESFDDTQANYISYCLTRLKFTDKTLTNLSDKIDHYTDKLKNPKVYNNFNLIISTSSRLAKPTTKDILSELSIKIERIVQDEHFAVLHSQKTPFKRLTTAKKKVLKRSIKKCTDNTIQALQVKTTQSTHSKVKRKLKIIDSEEEENNEHLHRTRSESKKLKAKIL